MREPESDRDDGRLGDSEEVDNVIGRIATSPPR